MQQESKKSLDAPFRSSSISDRRRSPDNAAEDQFSLLAYWKILKRRRYLFALPAIAISLFSIFYALSMPDVYRSVATILIEDQKLPEDIVGATITNYASQQIQLISQRLFTAKNIIELVDKFSVYGELDPEDRNADSKYVVKFRKDMELDLVSADVIDASGKSIEATVAFTLAFNSLDPEITQEVTEELVLLFLSENERSGASRTTDVSELLTSAFNKANDELRNAEANLAEFKAINEGALPELYQLNLDVINRNEQQLSDVKLRIQELQQRELQLSTELASLSPSAPVTLPSGETVMSDRERLKALLVDFRRKSSIYEADHPDLIRLEREIESLKGTVGNAESYTLIQEQLRQERERLSSLRDRYSEDHPDVRYSESAIANLESQLVSARSRPANQVEIADNPAYILINTQLQSTNLEMQSMLQKRSELQSIISEHEALIRKTPRVEAQYEELLRSTESARAKYNDLQAKLRAAEVAADVEQEISGRRFTLIEPPYRPTKPVEQNRPAIIFLGIVFALGVGVALVVLTEIMDNSIRSAKSLAKIVGAPPLAVIPYLDNSVDLAQARMRRIYIFAALFAVTVLCIVYGLYLI